jgi:arginine decarboxylase
MRLYITYGSGSGVTRLAAFDAALHSAGIANYNLIRLSSIVPPNSDVVVGKVDRNDIEVGYRLYVVLSDAFAEIPGQNVWAGLGWMYSDEYGGIFVEQQSFDERELSDLIKTSLKQMSVYRPLACDKTGIHIADVTCEHDPVCVVVAAIFESEAWHL